ncbi:MAG TPA: hypothetical protein VEW42_04300 [Candidatus Eisenbacteria bacterium]|nr:hypothetical protein [Candidatus Eisenbacteria bacterium]
MKNAILKESCSSLSRTKESSFWLVQNLTSRLTLFARRIKTTSRESGFTLVELLLYGGLFSVLLVVLLQIFTSLIGVQMESESTSAIAQDGQYVLAKLTYDISRSDAITMPATPGATSSAMTLLIASSSAAYTVSQGNLLLGTDRINSYATSVSNFIVKRLSNSNNQDSLQVSFILTSKTLVQGENKAETFQTTINRRGQ